jgi:Fur family transcriptional regulator, ferric uptake regulator
MTEVRRAASAGDLVDPEAIVQRLRDEGHTVGTTRRAILDAVRAKQRAFTADELAESLDDVHVSTVYRTLGLLEEIGVVRHVHLSHGPAMYERSAISSQVMHLVCEECGRHLTVPRRVFDAPRRALARDHGFTLDGSHFAIVGRCTECTESR